MFESRVPAIVTMLRGLLGEEITITAPDKDLHSGMYGGVAMNPICVLSRVLASLHDDQGRVTVPGFYDGVPELPDAIRSQWQGLAFDHQSFLGDVGLSEPAGEADRTPIEMIWSRPTCDVNGIWGGYTGEGFKTVLPSKASAKISFRLVGPQAPHAIRHSFRQILRDALTADCSVPFTGHPAGHAPVTETDAPTSDAPRAALNPAWGFPAAPVACRGPIPIAVPFHK